MTAPTVAVLVPHLRLTWGGQLGSPAVEIWSNGINWKIGAEAPSADELLQIAIAVAPTIRAWFGSPDTKIGNAASLWWIKAVWVLANGKQRDLNTAVYDLPINEVQAGGMAQTPSWNQSYAITLRTALQRGPGHAGRIYPPVSGPPPENSLTPYAQLATIQTMTQKFATALGEMKTAILGVIDPGRLTGASNGRTAAPVVVSRKTLTNPTAALTEITRVVIDRVADVMHSRTNRVERNEGAAANV